MLMYTQSLELTLGRESTVLKIDESIEEGALYDDYFEHRYTNDPYY